MEGFMLLVLTLACSSRPDCATLDDLGIDQSVQATADIQGPMPPFALGVEYMQTGLAEPYAETGVAWGKTRLEAFEWGVVEPDAPRGDEHDYDWTCTDAQIAEWQHAGIDRIQAYLSPRSDWGNDNPNRDIAPSADHAEDWDAFAAALFERYDGDGVDDMPGLVHPVKYWVLGGEWTGFWPSDDADGYLAWAEATSDVARDVYPDVKLGTVPFLLIDVFEGNEPTDLEIAERLARDDASWRNSMQGAGQILSRHELFDYISIHSLGDYTELPKQYDWWRAQMEARGTQKPVWIDDAFPVSMMANATWPLWYPVGEDERELYQDLLHAAAEDPLGPEAGWLEAEVAKGLVHKAITAMGEGYAGINVGNTEDWMVDRDVRGADKLRGASVELIGAASMFGLMDVTHPDGLDFDATRVAGSPRAGFFAMQLLTDAIGDGDWPIKEPLWTETTGMRGYRFERSDGEQLFVLWSEDGHLALPDETEEALPWQLATGSDPDVAFTPTTAVAAEWETWSTNEGQIELELTSAPVFVRVFP
jgi:hypothetical protein